MNWLFLAILGFTLGVLSQGLSAKDINAPSASPKAWVLVVETIVPLRENTNRNAATIGFIRRGQILAIKKSTENWVQVYANDTLVGWAPKTAFSPSGPPVIWNTQKLKGILILVLGLALSFFLVLALAVQRKRKADSEARAYQALLAAKRRLQNRLQILFRREPRMHSQLAMGEIGLLEHLSGIGYHVSLETEVEEFLSACKIFKPNLILAEAEFMTQVESLLQTDALLINTPVVYLHCDQIPPVKTTGVRAYLETPATDKELADAITLCLKKSPEKIHFSVQPTALKGGIHTGTLMELFHFLASLKKTGKLVVTAESTQGEVHFLLGNITRASTRTLKAEKAVQEILDQVSGSFEFYESEPIADGNAGMNTEKILMDWARTRDEGNHHTRN